MRACEAPSLINFDEPSSTVINLDQPWSTWINPEQVLVSFWCALCPLAALANSLVPLRLCRRPCPIGPVPPPVPPRGTVEHPSITNQDNPTCFTRARSKTSLGQSPNLMGRSSPPLPPPQETGHRGGPGEAISAPIGGHCFVSCLNKNRIIFSDVLLPPIGFGHGFESSRVLEYCYLPWESS